MEITTRPRSRRWRRIAGRLALLTAVLALGLLLPGSLGLSQHVVTDDAMGGNLSRGALLFDRPVRTSDQLRVGDVVRFVPSGTEDPVTRRVAAIDGPTVVTRGDTRAGDDPVLLDVARAESSLVVLSVPLLGYPELVAPWLTTAALVAMLGLAALVCALVARRADSPARVDARSAADASTSAPIG